MSYTQTDAAVDVCAIYAGTNVDSLDPDELHRLATQFVADCNHVTNGYDENGYERET